MNEAFRLGQREQIAQILSADWKLISFSGKIRLREDVLSEVNDPKLRFELNEVEQVDVRQWGDSAVLTGVLHQRFDYAGQLRDYRVWYTDTWLKLDGQWVQVSGHATAYTPPAG